jgi:hypothetical protein
MEWLKVVTVSAVAVDAESESIAVDSDSRTNRGLQIWLTTTTGGEKYAVARERKQLALVLLNVEEEQLLVSSCQDCERNGGLNEQSPEEMVDGLAEQSSVLIWWARTVLRSG